MAKPRTHDNIVWLDMEMTGLDPNVCHILEIACLVTDKDLNIISNLFHVVVYQPPSVMKLMNDWCKEHHSKSGLIKESEGSAINIEEAERLLLKFLKRNTVHGGCPLAGNSVYMDKIFLLKYLPKVADHLHYRIIDVSTISELCRRWYPNFKGVKKNLHHRAVPDVKESIEELKFFKKSVFPPTMNHEVDNCTQLLDMIGILNKNVT